jgi:hypothetical protein
VHLDDVVTNDMWEAEVPDDTVIVATEMLEHLVHPHAFVHRLAGTNAKWLVASSPYTETADSHYEFHTWAWDIPGYTALLENNGWRVIKTGTAWISQVLLAVKK